MAKELVMPQMGYDMQQGTVVRWIKKEGDQVVRGEPVAEIETDKAVVEMESIGGGVLRKIIAPEGTVAQVGEVIGIIAEPDEDISSLEAKGPKPAATAPPPPKASPAPAKAPAAEQPPAPASAGEIKASPVAKRLAQELGVNLGQVTGTGPGGRIIREDVEAAAQSPGAQAAAPAPAAAAPAEAGRTELTRMRQAIARITSLSKQQIPHYYVGNEIDMTAAMEMRRQVNEKIGGDPRVTVNDLIIKAVTIALSDFPALNASFKDDHLETHPYINIGIAIDLEQGLIVPSIANCEAKSLVEIARASTDLGKRAQEGRLHESEYSGGTFSISNLGTLDVDTFSAIILPPQSAVLAVGSVKKRPVVDDSDQIVVRQMMNTTLSADHRVSDGAEGARFLQELKRLLENPVSLVM
ncbi:MAG: dihydrolipoamide acetyltransferase family protein [Chloroflexi bacterium]|nr:dihydrolipoamide acetyltransferase family protein [Chloroflexota bacterium]